MKRSFFALVLLLPVLVCAEDIKRADGTILKGTIVRDEPDGLMVRTDAGIEKVDFLLLSTEVQKRFGFDPVKAREYRANRAVAKQQIVQKALASVQAQAVAIDKKQSEQPAPEEAARQLRIEKSMIFATASIAQGTSKGARGSLTVMTGHAAPTLLGKDTRATNSIGEAFIYGLEAADGETWKGKLFPAGYYHYTSPEGVESTVHAYALTVADAITHGADGREPTIPSVDPEAAKRFLPGNLRGGTGLEKP